MIELMLFYFLIFVWLLFCLSNLARSIFRRAASNDRPFVAKPASIKDQGFFGLKHLRKMFQYQRTYLESVLIPQFDQHGPTHDCNLLGTRFIFTAEPVNIKALFLGNFDNFEIGKVRRDAFKPLFGPWSVFITDGTEWRLARKTLRPFLNLRLDDKLPLVEEGVQKLFETIRSSDSGPNTSHASIEVKDAFRDLTANTVTRILTGDAFPTADVFPGASHNMPFHHACDIGMTGASKRSLDFLARPFAHRNFHTACEAAQQYILPIISKGLSELLVSADKSQSHSAKQTNWLSSTYTQAITGRKTKDIAKEALAVIIAGTDSTASLLSFTILLLAQRKETTISLRQSILERFGKDLTEEMSAKNLMTFEPLQHVINEVLRLYPPVPISFRVAKESCTLPSGGGRDAESPIFVAKGQTVAFSSYALHRRVDLWGSDAAEFRPNRWVGYKAGEWTYIPFNGGHRSCLGRKLALVEVSYVLVRILQNFTKFDVIPHPAPSSIRMSSEGIISKDKDQLTLPEHVFHTTLVPKKNWVHFTPADDDEPRF